MDQIAANTNVSTSWLQHVQTLQEVQQEAVRQYQQLWSEFASTIQGSSKDVNDRVTEACRTYFQDLQSVYDAPEARQAVTDAYQKYVEALQKYKTEGEQKAVDALNDLNRAADGQDKERAASAYNETLRNLWLDPARSHGVTEAYEQYVQAVQKSIADVQDRLNEANQKCSRAIAEAAAQGDVASEGKAAHEKYINGLYDLYRNAIDRVSSSANSVLQAQQKSATAS